MLQGRWMVSKLTMHQIYYDLLRNKLLNSIYFTGGFLVLIFISSSSLRGDKHSLKIAKTIAATQEAFSRHIKSSSVQVRDQLM